MASLNIQPKEGTQQYSELDTMSSKDSSIYINQPIEHFHWPPSQSLLTPAFPSFVDPHLRFLYPDEEVFVLRVVFVSPVVVDEG